MPFNVLLLPLLGGYIFISCWNPTRFHARRYSGQRLVFHAALAGTILLVLAFLVGKTAGALAPGLVAWWQRHVPFDYAGTSLIALGLGVLGWAPLNLFWDRTEAARKAVEERGDFLEVLISTAMEESRQVSLTLKSGKVYVGFITRSFDPGYDRKYIMLIPMLSGYREQETRQVVFTDDYARVYDPLIDSDPAFLDRVADEFQLVVPVAEIASANLFDPEVYEMFMSGAVVEEESPTSTS